MEKKIVVARVTCDAEKERAIKQLAKIINESVVFFNPSEISKVRSPAVYDNKSPYGIASPGRQ